MIPHTSQDTILVCPFDWALETECKKSGQSMFCLKLGKSEGKPTHNLASLLHGLAGFVHWTTKAGSQSPYIHIAEVAIVPGVGQSLPKIHLVASCDLKAFDQEIGALVSLATKGKPAVSPGKDSPMPPVPSPPPIDNGETGAQAAVENGEAGAQAAIQNGEADAEVEQGEDTRVDSPSPPVDSPEPEAARKRSADGPEGSPVPKRAKHTDTHGQSDDGEITLGEDSSFKFMLVGGHIFGQSLKSKRRIPGGTFVWASEDGKLEEHPDSPDLKDNPLLWSPTSRTKVWMLQDAEDPPKFVSVGELLKNHNLTQIVGKGPVTSKNISRKSCNLVWETKDKTTRAVLSAMSSKLEVSFVF